MEWASSHALIYELVLRLNWEQRCLCAGLFLCEAPWAFLHSVDSPFVSDKGYRETQNGKGVSESTEKPAASQQHPTIGLSAGSHFFIYVLYTHVPMHAHRGQRVPLVFYHSLPCPMRQGLSRNLGLILSLLGWKPAVPCSPRQSPEVPAISLKSPAVPGGPLPFPSSPCSPLQSPEVPAVPSSSLQSPAVPCSPQQSPAVPSSPQQSPVALSSPLQSPAVPSGPQQSPVVPCSPQQPPSTPFEAEAMEHTCCVGARTPTLVLMTEQPALLTSSPWAQAFCRKGLGTNKCSIKRA